MSTSVDAVDAEPPGPEGGAPPSRDASEASAGHGEVDFTIWALSALATVAAVLSRAVAPSLLGVWEGADHIIAFVTLAGAASSQLVAIGSAALVIGLVLGAVKSPLPQYVRAFSVGVGMLVLLALSISAIDVPLPSKSRMVVAGAASILVLMAARVSARIFTLRAASVALGAVAVAGLMRVVTVSMANHALEVASMGWGTGARVAATAHWAIDAVAVGFALAVLITHPQRRRRLRRPRWTLLGVVLTVPLVFVALVQLGADPERTGVVVLLSNIAHHNRILPAAFVPEQVRTYMEVLRWVAAAALLGVAPRSRMMAGALALALFTRSTLEVPLCAAAAVIAAFAVALHPGPNPDHDLPRP